MRLCFPIPLQRIIIVFIVTEAGDSRQHGATTRPKRRFKVKMAEPEVVEPQPKQRHYDSQAVQE